MRRPRLKVENGIYHCISRITGGRFWIKDIGKGMWCDQLRRVSVFCGVKVLTYAILDNHFHLLVHVPHAPKLSDTEIVERYRALYPHRPKLVEEVVSTLQKGGTQAEELRARLLARMHDVSQFLKELKQRFTTWFNAHHKLYGTIWDGRFKSIVVENDPAILLTVAAYVDLNPLRAGIVEKPELYRWSGMGAAQRGDPLAQSGITSVMRDRKWSEARTRYRQFVYEAGIRQVKEKPHATLDIEDLDATTTAQSLAARQRWLSEGWIVGSRDFVSQNLQHYFKRQGAASTKSRLNEKSLGSSWVVIGGRGRRAFFTSPTETA
jgi:REP element-mobilizing transposase RayT